MASPLSFDTVIIGSSPACMLHAIRCSKNKETVAIIDQSKSPGGVWKKHHSKSGDEYEIAPHLIANIPEAYRYIEEELGCAMLKLKPEPAIIFFVPKLGFIKLNWRLRFLYYFAIYMHSLITRKNRASRKMVWRDKVWGTIKETLHARNINFRYPKGGSETILFNLEKVLIENGGKIFLDTRAQKIRQLENHAEITTPSSLIKAKNIIITSSTDNIEIINAAATASLSEVKPLSLKYKSRKNLIIYIKIKDQTPLNISYTRIQSGRTCIQRVQNVTHYQNKTCNNEYLMVVQIEKESPIDNIFNDLKIMNLIHKNAELLEYSEQTIFTKCLDDSLGQYIGNTLQNVSYLNTTDLAVNLQQLSRTT